MGRIVIDPSLVVFRTFTTVFCSNEVKVKQQLDDIALAGIHVYEYEVQYITTTS